LIDFGGKKCKENNLYLFHAASWPGRKMLALDFRLSCPFRSMIGERSPKSGHNSPPKSPDHGNQADTCIEPPGKEKFWTFSTLTNAATQIQQRRVVFNLLGLARFHVLDTPQTKSLAIIGFSFLHVFLAQAYSFTQKNMLLGLIDIKECPKVIKRWPVRR
jgi:hypothetical protein